MREYDEGDPPRRVAITGIAGYLGQELASQLDVDAGTELVVGLDVATFQPPSPKVVYYRRTVEEPFSDLFLEHKIDAAVHLAFIMNPTHDRAHEERVNVTGTRNFLAACAAAKVKNVLILSSAAAYGAHPENAEVVLYEGAPLRPSADFPYARDKATVEDMCYEFAKQNPDVRLQIVRSCLVVGPNVDNFMSRLLDKRLFFGVRGHNPPIQFVHEDDAVRAIFRLLKSGKVGVFNLAADGAISLGRIAQLAGRRFVTLPLFLARFVLWLAWKLGWTKVAEVPPGFLPYLMYPWLVSNVKIKTELLFVFKYDGPRAYLDFLDARHERLTGVPRDRRDIARQHDSDELDDDELEDDTSGEPSAADAPTPIIGVPLSPMKEFLADARAARTADATWAHAAAQNQAAPAPAEVAPAPKDVPVTPTPAAAPQAPSPEATLAPPVAPAAPPAGVPQEANASKEAAAPSSPPPPGEKL